MKPIMGLVHYVPTKETIKNLIDYVIVDINSKKGIFKKRINAIDASEIEVYVNRDLIGNTYVSNSSLKVENEEILIDKDFFLDSLVGDKKIIDMKVLHNMFSRDEGGIVGKIIIHLNNGIVCDENVKFNLDNMYYQIKGENGMTIEKIELEELGMSLIECEDGKWYQYNFGLSFKGGVSQLDVEDNYSWKTRIKEDLSYAEIINTEGVREEVNVVDAIEVVNSANILQASLSKLQKLVDEDENSPDKPW